MGVRQEGDSNGSIIQVIAMAGGGARDECVNDPDGFKNGGSASTIGMHDQKPDAQHWASSFYRKTKRLE